ncbi:MAG: hypothetical protein ACHQAX_05560 [Gammaproteobacteria bacterium]
MNIHGNKLTLFHDNRLHSRMIIMKFFAYAHRTPAFQALGQEVIKVNTDRGTFICDDSFRSNEYVHVVFSKPITPELIDVYLDAMEEIENSLEIRQTFKRPFTYPLVDAFYNFLTGNAPLPEFNPNMPIVFLTAKDKKVLSDNFKGVINEKPDTLSFNHRYLQPLNTPNCVVQDRLPLTWWHTNQIQIAPSIQRARREREHSNIRALDTATDSFLLLVGVATWGIIKCCPRGPNRPRPD